jgi:hypothetical protein
MTADRFTLSQLFNVKANAGDRAEELLKTEQFEYFQKKIAEGTQGMKLAPSFSKDMMNLMMSKLDELLDIDVPKDIFAEAWSKHKSLLEYRDPAKYPPDKTYYVPLKEHPLTTKHTPSLEPTLAGKSLGKILVQVEVKFQIKAAILEIQDAKIKKIKLGTIEAKASLALGGMPFLTKDHTLELPTIFDMGEGVFIKDHLEKFKTPKPVGDQAIVKERVPAASAA